MHSYVSDRPTGNAEANGIIGEMHSPLKQCCTYKKVACLSTPHIYIVGLRGKSGLLSFLLEISFLVTLQIRLAILLQCLHINLHFI